MKLKLIASIFFLCIIVCCRNNTVKKTFTLHGKVKGDSPEYIFLEYSNIKDSALVKNNIFMFKGNVDFTISAELSIQPVSTQDRFFYLENKNIKIEIEVEKKKFKKFNVNFIKIDLVRGTETSVIQSDFENFKRKNKFDSKWSIKLFKKLNEIIEQYPKHRYSGDLLSHISFDSTLNINQLLALYKKLDTNMQAGNSMRNLREKIYPNMALKVGEDIVDFKLLNTTDKEIYTKSYRGSVLLIDFWASWCAPCREQNPKLLKIYNEFKNDDFEVLGVSIDTKKDRWLKAIEKDKLIWENVIDSRSVESEILTTYNAATSVPHNFLINRDGKIIAIDISMLELEETLKRIKIENN